MVCVVASLPDPNKHCPNLDVVESYAYLQKHLLRLWLRHCLLTLTLCHPSVLLNKTNSISPVQPAPLSASAACSALACLQVHCRAACTIHLPGVQRCDFLHCTSTMAQHVKNSVPDQTTAKGLMYFSYLLSWFVVWCGWCSRSQKPCSLIVPVLWDLKMGEEWSTITRSNSSATYKCQNIVIPVRRYKFGFWSSAPSM